MGAGWEGGGREHHGHCAPVFPLSGVPTFPLEALTQSSPVPRPLLPLSHSQQGLFHSIETERVVCACVCVCECIAVSPPAVLDWSFPFPPSHIGVAHWC